MEYRTKKVCSQPSSKTNRTSIFFKKNLSGARGYSCQLWHEIGPHILYRAVKIGFRTNMNFTGESMITGRAVIYFVSFQG